jgi:hypothetical protein
MIYYYYISNIKNDYIFFIFYTLINHQLIQYNNNQK